MKSRIINSAKNKKKNNKMRTVKRINCQTRSKTINTTRKIAHKGIDREKISIATDKKNQLNTFKDL